MRHTGLSTRALVLLLLTGAWPALAADASACYNIADSDARSYCIARARQDSSGCYNIKSASLRSQCLAEVRK